MCQLFIYVMKTLLIQWLFVTIVYGFALLDSKLIMFMHEA